MNNLNPMIKKEEEENTREKSFLIWGMILKVFSV